MKKFIFTFAIIGFVLVSCNKEKKAMKKLEGNWNVSAMTTDSAGVSVDSWAQFQAIGITSVTYNFQNCGTDVACDVYSTSTGSFLGFPINNVDTLTYSVSEDGETITLDGDEASIDELTKSSLIMSQVDGNTTTIVTMEKAD